jgi:hypothetical protein
MAELDSACPFLPLHLLQNRPHAFSAAVIGLMLSSAVTARAGIGFRRHPAFLGRGVISE